MLYITSCEKNIPSSYPDYNGQKGLIYDIEGNEYKTIGIGSQIWMAENLKTTFFNDGSLIPEVYKDSMWAKLHSPGYCWYNNDSSTNKKVYGALYNFYTIETGSLCPTGWHVPNKSEWNTLESFLGGNETAGGKLKDYNTPYWDEPNPCFVNNYGFSALPGGRRLNYSGRFFEIRESGNWWTSTSKDDFYAYSRSMSNESTDLNRFVYRKNVGCSVRCIKD